MPQDTRISLDHHTAAMHGLQRACENEIKIAKSRIIEKAVTEMAEELTAILAKYGFALNKVYNEDMLCNELRITMVMPDDS